MPYGRDKYINMEKYTWHDCIQTHSIYHIHTYTLQFSRMECRNECRLHLHVMYYSTMCVGYGAVKSFCVAGGVTITFSVSGESFSIALSSICTHLQRERVGGGGWGEK